MTAPYWLRSQDAQVVEVFLFLIVLSQDAIGCPKDLLIYDKFLKNIGLIARISTPRCLVDNLQRSLS